MRKLKYFGGFLFITFWNVCNAQNPIIQTRYTCDPAPMVYNEKVYLYADHDEEGSKYFTMNDWRVYSSMDMVNWTDLGSPLKYSDFKWCNGQAWATQCIHRNGKFYWYVACFYPKIGRHVVGVAVGDSPTGPFKDALGKPLIEANWGDIDPTVFIDDDGQAYLYWGNNGLWYVKLNKDMISYSGGIKKIDLTESAFGGVKTKYVDEKITKTRIEGLDCYEEGPWIYKRNGKYYLLYAAGGVPEHISYSTSDSPIGPWKYQGIIMPMQGGSFTNHCGIIDYKGRSYFFYHNGALPGGGGFTRSTCIEPFQFDKNGNIPTLNMTTQGVIKSVGYLNPFNRTEAETIAWEQGVKTEQDNVRGVYVTSIRNGDFIKIRSVNFGKIGASTFEVSVASATHGGVVELHLDKADGTIIGSLKVPSTGSWKSWRSFSTKVFGAKGLHDLYLVFKGDNGELFNIDYWKFRK